MQRRDRCVGQRLETRELVLSRGLRILQHDRIVGDVDAPLPRWSPSRIGSTGTREGRPGASSANKPNVSLSVFADRVSVTMYEVSPEAKDMPSDSRIVLPNSLDSSRELAS